MIMDYSNLIDDYENLLERFSESAAFGYFSVTRHLKDYKLNYGIRQFYAANALEYAKKLQPGKLIPVDARDNLSLIGGATEYLTKILLAKDQKISLKELGFLDNPNKMKYKQMTLEEMAINLYIFDVQAKFLIVLFGVPKGIQLKRISNKIRKLADISLSLIKQEFPEIHSIDFHPQGHVMYKGKVAVRGDGDLVINNCLIDFKTKKEFKLTARDRSQLFAYALHKQMRDGKSYDKVYFLNPRYRMLEELVEREDREERRKRLNRERQKDFREQNKKRVRKLRKNITRKIRKQLKKEIANT